MIGLGDYTDGEYWSSGYEDSDINGRFWKVWGCNEHGSRPFRSTGERGRWSLVLYHHKSIADVPPGLHKRLVDAGFRPPPRPAAVVDDKGAEIKYGYDKRGHRYRVDEFGIRIVKGSSRPSGILPADWQKAGKLRRAEYKKAFADDAGDADDEGGCC